MIIELSELRRVLEYLEDNNVKLVCVSFRPSLKYWGSHQLNIESVDENNGAGGNIEPYSVPENDLPF